MNPETHPHSQDNETAPSADAANGLSGPQAADNGGLPRPTGLQAMPPRPTIASTPPPAGGAVPQPGHSSGESAPMAKAGDGEPEIIVKELGEDEANDLYVKAKAFFIGSFGSVLPVVGVLVAAFCWMKTRKWPEMLDNQDVDDTSEMMLSAANMSQTWFVFSCVNVFVCLTSIAFPRSLITLSIMPLVAAVPIVIMGFLVKFLAYPLLDLEVDRYKSALVAVRAVAGCLAYSLVSSLMLMGALDFTTLPVYLIITSFAVYSVLQSYHRVLPLFRVLILSFAAWLVVGGLQILAGFAI